MLHDRTTPIEITEEEFKKVGYHLIDSIATFIHTIRQRPVTTSETREHLQSLLGTNSLPEIGTSAEVIMSKAVELLFNHSLINGHPKFLGYITSSPAPIGMLADLLAAAVNPNVGANILSPMATEIETQTVRWLAELIGVDPTYGGILVSGGNMANFTALVAARTAKIPKGIGEDEAYPSENRMVLYCSRATHTWVEKAAVLFGIGTAGIHWIEQDDNHKIRIDLLEQAIVQDLQEGKLPFLVIGNAGDVSTGVVDDLKSIGAVCKRYDLWFHIDGAYGIPAVVVPKMKFLFEGLEAADSIALDPHKWLYSPLEAGCTLVKNPQTLLDAYSSHPAYYNFDDPQVQTHNYYEYGFQNSRGFRALKVWAALQHVGRSGYVKMIGEDIELSALLYRLAQREPELEAVTQHLSITTFRYVTEERSDAITGNEDYLNELNKTLLNVLQKNGEVFLSNAVIKEKYCLRACIVNFRTSENDIKEIINIVVREGRKVHDALKCNFNN